MRFFSSVLLICGVLLAQSAQASLFTIQQQALGADKVEISVLASDLSSLRTLHHLYDDTAELYFNYLSGVVAFSDAWDKVPVVQNSFNVNRLVDSLNLISDDNNRELTINAAFSLADLRPVVENEILFSFVVSRPQDKGQVLFLSVDLGGGEPIVRENRLERLQEAEPNNSGIYAQTTVTAVPLPGAHLFMITGVLLLSGARRLSRK